MKKVKISEFEFEVTNKLINGTDVKLKNPEKQIGRASCRERV